MENDEKEDEIRRLMLLREITRMKNQTHDNSTALFLKNNNLQAVSEEHFGQITREMGRWRRNGKMAEEHLKGGEITELLLPGLALCALSSEVELIEWRQEEDKDEPRRGYLALIHGKEKGQLIFHSAEADQTTYNFHDFSYVVSSSNKIVLPMDRDTFGAPIILSVAFPTVQDATNFAESIVLYSFGLSQLFHANGPYALEKLNRGPVFRHLQKEDKELDIKIIRSLSDWTPEPLSSDFPSSEPICPSQTMADWAEQILKGVRYIEWKYSRICAKEEELEALQPILSHFLSDADIIYHLAPFCTCHKLGHPTPDDIMDTVIRIRESAYLCSLHAKLPSIVRDSLKELTDFTLKVKQFVKEKLKEENILEFMEFRPPFCDARPPKKFSQLKDNFKMLKRSLRNYYNTKATSAEWGRVDGFLTHQPVVDMMRFVLTDIYEMTKKAFKEELTREDFEVFDELDKIMRSGAVSYFGRREQQLISELNDLRLISRRPDHLAAFVLGPDIQGVQGDPMKQFADSLTGKRSVAFGKIANQLATFDVNFEYIRDEIILSYSNYMQLYLDYHHPIWVLFAQAVEDLKKFARNGGDGENGLEVPPLDGRFNLGIFSKVLDKDLIGERKTLGVGVVSVKHESWGTVTVKGFEEAIELKELEAVRELALLKGNFVGIRGFYYRNETDDYPRGYVMEVATMSLHDLIHKKYDQVDEYRFLLTAGNVLTLIQRLSTMFTQLHKYGWIHRDIKPANILLDEQSRVLICDFGLTHRKGEHGENASLGTIVYKAPELINTTNVIDEKVDVYAFGVMIWEMANRRLPYSYPPFYNEESRFNEFEIENYVASGQRMPINCQEMAVKAGDDVSEKKFKEAKEYIMGLIERCWDQEPGKRPTMKDIEAEAMTRKCREAGERMHHIGD